MPNGQMVMAKVVTPIQGIQQQSIQSKQQYTPQLNDVSHIELQEGGPGAQGDVEAIALQQHIHCVK